MREFNMRAECFNQIFVISLKRSQERRESISKQLDELGFKFEFVDAVDGRNLNDVQLSKYSAKASMMASGRELSPAEIGCALSHLGIYHKIMDEGIERAIIFEDDSVIKEDFPAILANWKKIPKDWEIFLFCHAEQKMQFWRRWGKPTIYKNYYCATFRGHVGLTSAYAINRRGVQKMLAYAYPVRMAADGLTGGFMNTGARVYGIFPDCCYQSNDFRSLIDPSRFAPG
jgi:glycosyl transferase family 25